MSTFNKSEYLNLHLRHMRELLDKGEKIVNDSQVLCPYGNANIGLIHKVTLIKIELRELNDLLEHAFFK